jgi:hypothetical protein
MVVDELNVVRLTLGPPKYDAPLVVDSNAVESRPIASQDLQSISGWRAKVEKRMGCVDLIELPQGRGHDVRRDASRATGPSSVKEVLSGLITE